MMQTVEVEIDQEGRIHPLEDLPFKLAGRAYLTLLPAAEEAVEKGDARRSAQLLSTPRFADRPPADMDEVARRIEALRDDWGNH